MSETRPTLRPVTLARLVEVTHLCAEGPKTTEDVESHLDVSHRRARETVLESTRLDLIREVEVGDDSQHAEITPIGEEFLEAVQKQDWETVSDVLRETSPHYEAFLDVLRETQPIRQDELLEKLEEESELSPVTFNATSIDVVADWADRLGKVNRNAFTGACYFVDRDSVPEDFPSVLLEVFDELESSAGVNLRQRYLSIPEIRENTCERLRCSREAFDEALLTLVSDNVGTLELSGAPIDTGAKEARYGIKEIALSNESGLVSTSQSTEAVLNGIEQYGKQYYYIAVHDRDLTFSPDTES